MKNFKLLFVFFIIAIFGCQKDDLLPSKDTDIGIKQFKWNEQETIFFDLKRKEEVTETRTRTNLGIAYHPLLIESYNELATQNDGDHFVTQLISKIGYPLWNKSIIRNNQGTESDLILIPFTAKNGTSTSGILVSYKKNNSVKFDIVTRSEFLQENSSQNCFKKSYLNEIRKFDHKLFNLYDAKLTKLYCDCKSQSVISLPPSNPTSGGEPCPWALIELCTNGEHDSWIGGLCKTPIHLDHDLDCIPNEDDQDFYELTQRFGFTQQDWADRVRQYWDELYPDIDYDDFFEDPDNYDDFFDDYFDDDFSDPSGGFDFGDFWEDFQDGLLDWVFDPDHDDIWNWDDQDDDGNGWDDRFEDCPWDPIINSQIESRTITCETYYVRNCDGTDLTDPQWWDVIGYLIPCPGCTEQHLQDFEQMLSIHLNNYIDTNLGGDDYLFSILWPLVQDCPAYAPANFVTECIENKLEEYLNSIGNVPNETSGFIDRTLSCESYWFYPQSAGSGQIACVDKLYLSKQYLNGIYANTDEFCVSFTVPRTIYNGQTISAGKASDCAAWASNASAAVCGFVFAQSFADNNPMEDLALKQLFKLTFNIKMKLTDCGYGSATDCSGSTCIGSTKNAIWNTGFFDWIDEQLFGCE